MPFSFSSLPNRLYDVARHASGVAGLSASPGSLSVRRFLYDAHDMDMGNISQFENPYSRLPDLPDVSQDEAVLALELMDSGQGLDADYSIVLKKLSENANNPKEWNKVIRQFSALLERHFRRLDNLAISARSENSEPVPGWLWELYEQSLENVRQSDSYKALAGIERSRFDREPATITIYPSGFYARGHSVSSYSPPGGTSKRGAVTGFSHKSKARLMRRLAQISWQAGYVAGKRSTSAASVFLTLTYPKQFPDDWEDYKAHLRAFRERLTRYCARLGCSFSCVWKLEFQKRGAPHFHLLLFFSKEKFYPFNLDVRQFRTWARGAWNQIADNGSSGKHHQKRGADTLPVYLTDAGIGALMGYLAKYLGKPFDAEHLPENGTGRCWGVWNEQLMPYAMPIKLRIKNFIVWLVIYQRILDYGESVDSWYISSLPLTGKTRFVWMPAADFYHFVFDMMDYCDLDFW